MLRDGLGLVIKMHYPFQASVSHGLGMSLY